MVKLSVRVSVRGLEFGLGLRLGTERQCLQ